MNNKNNNNNNNDVKKSRQEWQKEWGLEKQTEGLDKNAVQEQERIGQSLEKESKNNNQ